MFQFSMHACLYGHNIFNLKELLGMERQVYGFNRLQKLKESETFARSFEILSHVLVCICAGGFSALTSDTSDKPKRFETATAIVSTSIDVLFNASGEMTSGTAIDSIRPCTNSSEKM